MVDEVEGLREAEKLVEDYLRRMTASEINDEISYYRSALSSHVPKDAAHQLTFVVHGIASLCGTPVVYLHALCGS